MKKTLLFVCLSFLTFTGFSQGLKQITVEKYYVANADDADASGGTLPVGAVTYRLYAEMDSGFFLVQVMGTSDHILEMSTTGTFFNAESGDAKPNFTLVNVKNDLNALDTWVSTGNALKGAGSNMGVLKSEDANGSVLATAALLKNDDASAGIPISVQDGMMPGVGSAPDFNFAPGLDSTFAVFGDNTVPGNKLKMVSGSWYTTTRPMGPTKSNRVLIAQVTTTDGTFHYDINLIVNKDLGGGFSQGGYYTYGTPVRLDSSANWTVFTGPQYKLSGTYPVPANIPTISINTDKSEYKNGENAIITATAADADGTISHVEFYVNDTLRNTDNDSPFAYSWPVKGTNAIITAYAYDNDGNKSLISNAVNISISVGIHESIARASSFSIYPNPANDAATLTISVYKPSKKVDYKILSVDGRVVADKSIGNIIENYEGPLDVAGLTSGQYIIELSIDGIKSYKKFIKE